MKRRPLTDDPKVREFISAQALDYILGAYKTWNEHRNEGDQTRSEPRITPVVIRDYIRQMGGVPDDFKFDSKKRQADFVRSILNSLVRIGKLTTSLGEGERGGEVRLYEPKSLDEGESK